MTEQRQFKWTRASRRAEADARTDLVVGIVEAERRASVTKVAKLKAMRQAREASVADATAAKVDR